MRLNYTSRFSKEPTTRSRPLGASDLEALWAWLLDRIRLGDDSADSAKHHAASDRDHDGDRWADLDEAEARPNERADETRAIHRRDALFLIHDLYGRYTTGRLCATIAPVAKIILALLLVVLVGSLFLGGPTPFEIRVVENSSFGATPRR
jgi:hypothetical protein